MKFYWEQLSPGEKDALLRHFLMKRRMDAPVTAEGVCAALQKTHQLSCESKAGGKSVIEFVTTVRGVRSGASQADDLAEGIYKAALRAQGVDIDDGLVIAIASESKASGKRAGTTRQTRAHR